MGHSLSCFGIHLIYPLLVFLVSLSREKAFDVVMEEYTVLRTLYAKISFGSFGMSSGGSAVGFYSFVMMR